MCIRDRPISNDAEFKGITEMAVNVHLLNGWIGGGMGRHGAIGGFVRVIGVVEAICFFEGFKLLYDTVGVFGIIFCYPCFNARGVKEQHRGFCFINRCV